MDILNSYDNSLIEKKFYKLQFLNQKDSVLDFKTIKEISSLIPWEYSIYEIIDLFSDPNIRFFARNIGNLVQIERVNTQIRRITQKNVFFKNYEKLEEFAFLFSTMGDLSLNFYNFKNQFDKITVRILELFEINKKFLNDQIKLHLFIHTLCKEEGLKGMENAYNSVDSIFISQVMKKKIGIPISLSVIYLIIASRLQLPVYGMNLPLHFILFYHSRCYQTYFDPYHSGVFFDKSICTKFLESNGYISKEEYFTKSSISAIIKRLYRSMILLFRKYRKEPEKDALIYQLNLIENQN